jgi:hypothetical protein
MAKSYQRTLLIALLTLAPIFGACEQVDISGVTDSSTPMLAAKSKTVRLLERMSSDAGALVVTEWTTPGKSITLEAGKYKLVVPKEAVKTSTMFRMTVLTGPVIGVSLEAWDNQGNAITKFQVPLHLTLPYDGANPTLTQDPSRLLLANIKSAQDPTILEVINPSVNPVEQTITGCIKHFSVWSIALELSKELSPGID